MSNKIRMLLLSAIVLTLLACGTADLENNTPLEPLLSYSFGAQAFKIEVVSTGCSKHEDFRFVVDRTGSIVSVSVHRTQPDRCRMAPHARLMEFSLAEVGLMPGEEITLANKIVKLEPPQRK